MSLSSELVVVIRTVGERTFEACKALVLQQVPETALHIVSEQPFELTLRRCYEVGINSGVPWMMTLDADVLLREGAVADFLTAAEALPPEYFQLEGLLHDKLSGLCRNVGHRMYRTQYLDIALQHLPSPRNVIRPEYTTLQKMGQLGYLSQKVDIVFGVHDYEQYYSDIYRKAFVHAQKHPEWLSRFVERWRASVDEDADYIVALRGLYDGLIAKEQATIDKRDFIGKAALALKDLELIEKAELNSSHDWSDQVSKVLFEAALMPSQTPLARSDFPRSDFQGKLQRLKKRYTQLGLLRFSLYSLGAGFNRLGRRLQHMANLKV